MGYWLEVASEVSDAGVEGVGGVDARRLDLTIKSSQMAGPEQAELIAPGQDDPDVVVTVWVGESDGLIRKLAVPTYDPEVAFAATFDDYGTGIDLPPPEEVISFDDLGIADPYAGVPSVPSDTASDAAGCDE
jgi:hypothetical protein